MPFELNHADPVYMEPTGNAARSWDGNPIVGYVESIGRKYYYVLPENPWYGRIKVDKQTNTCLDRDFNQGFIVFPSREAFDQAQGRKELLAKIRKAFDFGGAGNTLPYADLKSISEILDKNTQTD